LLASDRLEDNVIAVLMRLSDERAAVRRVLQRIADGKPEQRTTALAELAILAGLRKLSDIITQEVQQMPILDDIMDNPILGPRIRARMSEGIEIGRREGREEGRQEGRKEGRQEGERAVVLRLTQRRFGAIPDWAKQKIDAMSLADLQDAELRLLDAPDLEDLLR
jgi:predicted transposase YdaD